MVNTDIQRFEQAASQLGSLGQEIIRQTSPAEKAAAYEIRIRCGARPCITLPSGIRSLCAPQVTRSMIEDAVLEICGHSIYSHQNELASGFVTLHGGHRVGVCGTAVAENGRLISVRDISTLNVRIAREISSRADELLMRTMCSGLCGIMIAGAPCTGKTTLLRAIAERLAENGLPPKNKIYRVSIVDERGEIAAVKNGMAQNRVGLLCDVLNGYTKDEGMTHAIRCLSPDVIICDEIGTPKEISAVEQSVNAGVRVICTVHAGSEQELLGRIAVQRLLRTGAFEKIVLLDKEASPGTVEKIIDAGVLYENNGRNMHDSLRDAYRA